MKEEKDGEAKAVAVKDEMAADLAAEWGLLWPPPDRKGKWGRLSKECVKNRKLYAQIQRIVDGMESKPANPPLAGKGSSTSNSLAGNGDHPVSSEEVGYTSQPAATSSKCIVKEPKHVKLHRPRWARKLFFSLQSSQKLSDKDMCDWVKIHMSDVFCPDGNILGPTTVSTWKKQIQKEANTPKLQEPEAITGKKRGPKPKGPCGQVPDSKNTKVSYRLLCILASMIAGFPLSSTLLMPMVLGFFQIHKISWVPSKSWYSAGSLEWKVTPRYSGK